MRLDDFEISTVVTTMADTDKQECAMFSKEVSPLAVEYEKEGHCCNVFLSIRGVDVLPHRRVMQKTQPGCKPEAESNFHGE